MHLPPVLFTRTGSFGAVDYLSQPWHDSRHIGEGGVSAWSAQHSSAVRSVPGVVTVRPGQQVCHGHEEVIKCNANHNIVVNPNIGRDHHHSIAHTLKEREQPNYNLVSVYLVLKTQKPIDSSEKPVM